MSIELQLGDDAGGGGGGVEGFELVVAVVSHGQRLLVLVSAASLAAFRGEQAAGGAGLHRQSASLAAEA